MRKVFVAMSGGVDSSVAAALLKKRGFNVVGVLMKPWQPEISKYRNIEISASCLWQKDREDALRVAAKLEIPLLTWDFSKEYKKSVIDYMIREYKAGRTPNPDVMCNKHIKFSLFLKRALKEGADYIATGHYVRLRQVKSPSSYKVIKNKNYSKKLYEYYKLYKLFTAVDKNKDQSYFLWTLAQEQLKYCLFPIGDYTKPEVRRLAKKFGLPTADKKDSQGVCFIGPLDMKEFLKKYIKSRSGQALNMNGQLLGKHDGVFYYTIGQRHGLNLGIGAGPYFVIKKDIKKNIIYVGKEEDLYGNKLKISKISWVNSMPRLPAEIGVKIRYRTNSEPATLGKGSILKFKKPQRAITPGQSAVFYKGEELLGGGTIR